MISARHCADLLVRIRIVSQATIKQLRGEVEVRSEIGRRRRHFSRSPQIPLQLRYAARCFAVKPCRSLALSFLSG
jgi:hypothetical protein